jgi:flagellar basal body-associated protein FliL
MSDAKKEEHKKYEGEPKPPKFGMLKLVPVVLVFSLLNLGAAGFTVFKVMTLKIPAGGVAHADGEHGEGAEGADHGEAAEGHGEGGGAAGHGEAASEPFSGVTVPLDPFVVNLNESGSNRYLKATFEIEVRDQKAADAVTKAKSVVRDDILRYLSELRVADTLGATNKQRILDEVRDRLEAVVGKRKIERAFITEFVVQ